MNRFNKIMLLGLLSIVTGATSVKGMGFKAVQIGGADSKFFVMPKPNTTISKDVFANARKINGITKFIALDKNFVVIGVNGTTDKVDASDYCDMKNATLDTIAAFLDKFSDKDVICVYPGYEDIIHQFSDLIQLSQKSTSGSVSDTMVKKINRAKEAMPQIATLYACWMIKNDANSPLISDADEIDLNDHKVKLSEAQASLVRDYFISKNISVLGKDSTVITPTVITSASTSTATTTPTVTTPKAGFFSRNKGKILTSAAVLSALPMLYLAAGTLVYNYANCTDESSSSTCTYTAPANATSIAAYEFLAAAAVAAGTSVASLLKWITQSHTTQSAGNSSFVNTTLPVEQIGSTCTGNSYEVLDPQDCARLMEQVVAHNPTLWDAATQGPRNLFNALTLGYFKNN